MAGACSEKKRGGGGEGVEFLDGGLEDVDFLDVGDEQRPWGP